MSDAPESSTPPEPMTELARYLTEHPPDSALQRFITDRLLGYPSLLGHSEQTYLDWIREFQTRTPEDAS